MSSPDTPPTSRSGRRAAREAAERQAREARRSRVTRFGKAPLVALGVLGFVVLQVGVWGMMTGQLAFAFALLLIGIGAGGMEMAWRLLTAAPDNPSVLARVPYLSALLVLAVLVGWLVSRAISS